MQEQLAARVLPSQMRTPLFGFREEDSYSWSAEDPDWRLWESVYHEFYSNTQISGLGGFLTRQGYEPLRDVDLTGKSVLEIGPGSLPHRHLWAGLPDLFISVDVDPKFHIPAKEKCGTDFLAITRDRGDTEITVPSESVDVVLSFYSLEHLENLAAHTSEMVRILRPGGLLVGAVPNEGGLAWGLARFLGTRRWITRRFEIDYDKIIAWEHPNYVDTIQRTLEMQLTRVHWNFLPAPFLRSFNLNLISSFVYSKAS